MRPTRLMWHVGALVLKVAAVIFMAGCSKTPVISSTAGGTSPPPGVVVKIPEPRLKSSVSLEEALLKRRSVRE